jgi:transposase
MIKVQLTESQRMEIEKFRHQVSSKDSEKALMVLMNADGRNVSEISNVLRRNPHTVRDWLKRYKVKGLPGLSRRFSSGRPDEKRSVVKDHIKETIPHSPEKFGYVDRAWTVPLIAHDIENTLNISVSNDTVIRSLKDLGYSYKRPSKTMPPSAPTREEKTASIQKMINEIEAIIKDKDSVIYALDESHFSTEPYLVQGWFFKRWPPPDIDQQQERKSHILWLLEFKDKKVLLEALSTS